MAGMGRKVAVGKRQVRCVDCGFLMRSFPGFMPGDHGRGPSLVNPAGRQEIRDGRARQSHALGCLLGLASYDVGCEPPPDPYVDAQGEVRDEQKDQEYEACIMANVRSGRSCSEFYRFQPGYGPEEHRALREKERSAAQARRWDVQKMIVTEFVKPLVAGLLVFGAGVAASDQVKAWLAGLATWIQGRLLPP